LCNTYPAVSHSFVRREIEAVERAGHHVFRFSLRPFHRDIKDPADLHEAAQTLVILGQGWLLLASAALCMVVAHPLRTCAAVATAFGLSGKGFKQKARHVVYLLEAAWLVRRLWRMKVQHLHAHFGTNPAAIAVIARAWGGPPFSFTVHGPDEFDAPVELRLREKVQSATFVAAISSYCRSQLMRWIPEAQWSKLKLIRCGLDSAFFDVKPSAPPAESVEFVTVARLSQQKGLPLLVEACARLRDTGARFHLTIVGFGDMREALQSKIRSHDLGDCITLAGIRSSEEIRGLLLGARAFVLPSFAEGLPVVLMEALALARPVITTAIAGIPELVDEHCGWLIPAGSEADLVQAMISALAASSEELLSKGMIGRERVLRLHDIDDNASRLLEAISNDGPLER
jgi:glycosyltransferase involved in cell wall biosynthesis